MRERREERGGQGQIDVVVRYSLVWWGYCFEVVESSSVGNELEHVFQCVWCGK